MTATLAKRSLPDRSPTPPPALRRRDWFTVPAAALCAAAAFVVGYVDIGRRELWDDEFATWHAARLTAHQMRILVGNIDLVHAFYYVIVHAWITLAGDTPAGLRMLSLIAVAGTAALTVLVGRRLFGLAVGVPAAALFAALPVTSRYAQEARSYALVTFMAMLATWLMLWAVDRPTRLRWTLYCAALVVIGWLHFVALLVVGGHLVYVALTARRRDWRWQWTVAAGTASLFVLPLLVFASRESSQISWVKGDLGAVQKMLIELVGGLWMFAVVVPLAVLGIVLAGSRRPAALMVAAWAVLPPVFGYLSFPWLHLFMARYFLFAVPALCLLVAFGAYRAGLALTRYRFAAVGLGTSAVTVAAVALLGLPAQKTVRQPTLAGQPPYALATRYLAANAQPTDGVAFNDGFGAATDLARKATDYQFRHTRDRPRDVFLAQPARDRGWLTALECADAAACLGDTKRVWLIETGHPGNSLTGLPPARAALFQHQFVIRHVEKFPMVRVVELDRKPNP